MYWVFEPNMLRKALRAYCREHDKGPDVEQAIIDFLCSEQAREYGMRLGDDVGIKADGADDV